MSCDKYGGVELGVGATAASGMGRCREFLSINPSVSGVAVPPGSCAYPLPADITH